MAPQLLDQNEALRSLLQQELSDATPEVMLHCIALHCTAHCLSVTLHVWGVTPMAYDLCHISSLSSACLLMQALLLALRLWPAMSAAVQAACPLLPDIRIPGASAAWAAQRTTAFAASAEAAAAFFEPAHLAKLLPVFRGTTAAHPRLHSLWPTVLALLLPGFAPKRVGMLVGPQHRVLISHRLVWQTQVDLSAALIPH